MVNCNPETVSTDYDTADRLYFEPLTFEDVLEVWHAEDTSGRAAGGPGVVGVIVQLGGQTPLGLAQRLKAAGVPIVGTSPESIHLAEDRGAFGALLGRGRAARAGARHRDLASTQAKPIADEIGYPVLVRPSYVLGGRGMEIVYDDATLRGYIARATEISPEHPVLVDRFLDDAIEIDVDALVDATGEVYLGGVMEHIEEAGIHSGDSACALPPITLGLGRRGRGAPLHRGDRAAASACAGCSTCSTRSRTTRSTCWRPTRGRRGRCRSCRRRPRCRWPRRRPGSCSAPPSPSCGPRACCRPPATAASCRRARADRGQGGGAAVQAVPHRRRARAWTACSARR